MKIKELIVEGPLGTIGKGAGLAAKGAGAVAGGAVGGVQRFIQGYKRAAADMDAKMIDDPKEKPIAKSAGTQTSDQSEIFKQITPQDLKPILANVLGNKPLDDNQMNSVSKIFNNIKDPNYQEIFKNILYRRDLNSKQINSIQNLHDKI